MRDSISVARKGLPAIALVTTEFWPQGDFVSHSNGMPDVPRIQLPHPVAGSGEDNMGLVADDIAPTIAAILQGS